MNHNKRCVLAVICCLAVFVQSCGVAEVRAQKSKLTKLAEAHATEAEVKAVLGTNYIRYHKGEPAWDDLTKILQKEPTNRLVAVRRNIDSCSTIMLYSTPDIMTWVFVGETGRMVDFAIGAQ